MLGNKRLHIILKQIKQRMIEFVKKKLKSHLDKNVDTTNSANKIDFTQRENKNGNFNYTALQYR